MSENRFRRFAVLLDKAFAALILNAKEGETISLCMARARPRCWLCRRMCALLGFFALHHCDNVESN